MRFKSSSLPHLACSAIALAAASAGAAESAPLVQRVSTTLDLSFERVRLPGGEPLGLLGANDLFEVSPGWLAGPALYGAASGQRGGLFTWGVEAQHRWSPSPRWRAVAGLYVGGGGGAQAPVGGGLMLRPHADLLFGFGAWGAGISVSQVRFPSGSISSTQAGLVFVRDSHFAYVEPGHAGLGVDFLGDSGLGNNRAELVVGHYSVSAGAASNLGTIGLRLEHQWGPVLATTIEADGAASGGADGYAEATAGVQALWPVGGQHLRLGAHAAVGLAGGGAVATGAGPIIKAGAMGRLELGPRWSLGFEAGKARAPHGEFRAKYGQLSLGVALDELTGCDLGFCRKVHEMEWALGYQTYLHAQRKDGHTAAMGVIDLEFNRWLDPNFYLSGQALTAVTGGAGAYSAGLVGPGVAWRDDTGWSTGAEMLVGAAGGGGVASQGGAVAQPMVWAGRDLGRYGRLHASAGYLKSARGALATPVLGISWLAEFGLP